MKPKLQLYPAFFNDSSTGNLLNSSSDAWTTCAVIGPNHGALTDPPAFAMVTNKSGALEPSPHLTSTPLAFNCRSTSKSKTGRRSKFSKQDDLLLYAKCVQQIPTYLRTGRRKNSSKLSPSRPIKREKYRLSPRGSLLKIGASVFKLFLILGIVPSKS